MRDGQFKYYNVWFALPVDFSPELNSSEYSHAGREFHRLLEDSDVSELSQYSYTTPQQSQGSGNQLSQYSYATPQECQDSVNQLSQYSYSSLTKSRDSANELSQYSVKTMDTNSTNETYSTNESQDISTSQQSSEANLSQSGLEDGPSVASSVQESQHEEVVNSAIMEVSGELMLGKLTHQKYPSGGSESSDISDDDSRRMAAGGAIVKYPESSTGMSDNDWNPYATESDTNQTPRSAASDEPRLTIGEPVTAVSMVTGEITRGAEFQPQLQTASGNVSDDYRVIPRAESESYKPRYRDDTSELISENDMDSRSGRLDILRYMIDDGNTASLRDQERQVDNKTEQVPAVRTSPIDRNDERRRSVESTKSDISELSQKSQGGFSRDSEETLKGRESAESARSLQLELGMDIQRERLSLESAKSEEKSRRESAESMKSHHSERTDSRSGRQSAESGRSDEFRRESTESYKSLPAEEFGGRSGRQSSEASRSPRSGYQSVESWKSPRSELDRSGEARSSGRESAESQHSVRSERSRGSEHSVRSQRSQGSAGNAAGLDRLDKLNEVGGNIKELIELESAQRPLVDDVVKDQENLGTRLGSPKSDDLSKRVRLSEKFEAYKAPARSLQSPAAARSAGYISIAERERLLSQSPDFTGISSQTHTEDTVSYKPDSDFKEYQQDSRSSSARVGGYYTGTRSPTGVAINRVSDLFEETKKQSRAAVSLPRPDPSGSEERFPLKERLSVSQHADDSFKSHDRTGHSGISEKSRDSETARSITSEEVARVLGKYADTEAELKRTRLEMEKENRTPGVKVSAFDKIDRNTNALTGAGIHGTFDATHPDMSDDKIAKRVRAILSDTEYLGIVGGNGKTLPRETVDPTEKYIPHTIDYSKLQRDLQEIQDSLHDVPPPKANDSLYQFRQPREAEEEQNLSGTNDSVHYKSAETTSTSGRESGISNFGRKLAWDHAADLNYDDGYTGHFYGTMSTDTDTLGGTQKLRKSGTSDSDNLVVRAESTTTNDSENDDVRPENTMAAAQSVVDQVLSRHAEGPLQETVEDIIARYKNERQDLFYKFQPGKDPASEKISRVPQEPVQREGQVKDPQPSLPTPKVPSTQAPSATTNVNTNAIKPVPTAESQPGLAERVYKILSSDQQPESYQAPPPQLEQGMAKKVYQILSSDRPGNQVNGILTDTLEKEHEMLKKLVQHQQAEKDDSSFEVPPRLNGTSDSFALSERDVRRQLEWSLLSSPEKGDKTGISDFSTIRKVTSAPYNSVDTAKTLLSSQMQKMSARDFDKSVELRTPFRQAIDCYPLYGVERDRKQEPEQRTREAWMPVPNPSKLSPEKAGEKRDALASERFYLTHKDGSPRGATGTQHAETPQKHRTYSDPFEISTNRNPVYRGHHPRSKSEGPADVSDLTQCSYESTRYDPTNRRAASSSHRLSTGTDTSIEQPGPVGLVTPAKHNPQDSGHESISPTESDSSGSKKLSKLRPYRPAGSRDVYYTESADDTNESGTTIESTHPGSDDAVPPYIPKQYLGSRMEEPSKHPTGIYSTSSKDALSTIDEKSQDEKEKASAAGSSRTGSEAGAVGREPEAQLRARSMYTDTDRSREPASKESGSQSMAADTGYQTGATAKSSYDAERSREAAVLERQRDEARLRELELKRKIDSLREKDLARVDVIPSPDRHDDIDSRILKTRDEYLRDLEARERENMLRLQYSDEKRDPFGASVRSDPGGSLEGRRDTADLAEFKYLEPEPIYPQERIRYSRSRSETDLNALSPAESQKYSSPMQPGTRFMELSSQPSPISHHESLRAREPERQIGPHPSARTMTTSREPERQIGPHPAVRTVVTTTEARDPVRETVRDRSESPRTDRNFRYPAGARMLDSDRAAYSRVGAGNLDTGYPLELPRVEDRHYPMELPVVTQPRVPPRDVDREVEPAEGRQTRQPAAEKRDHPRSISPLYVREKELERELEEMNREIAAQVQEVQGKAAVADTEEFEDNFPPSKKAQVLREVLEQEYMDNIPPNINDMWTRFKELNDNTRSESSLNSTRLDALSGLLQNPTQHAVNSFLSEKEEEKKKRKVEVEEAERVKAEQLMEMEREKRLVAEKAAYERIVKKREMRQQQQRLSEEESNGSYAEILMEREKKEKGKDRQRSKEGHGSKEKKSTPESEKAHKKSRKDKENRSHKSPEEKPKQIKDRRREALSAAVNVKAQHSDTMDTLFSIPEDASFETSPTKSESDLKARQKRHRHVIDPLMKKLRDKIKLQRDKINKERRKELQRVEKLKKLEMLLTAKRKGKLSDKAIDVELQDVSSTTSISQSETSIMSSEVTLTAGSTTMESDGSSQGSTTLKESSVDSHITPRLQYKKYPETEGFITPKKRYSETDSSATHSETSDFSNIIVERLHEKRSERKSSGKKSGSKEKKPRTEESGHKIRKEKERKKNKVFGVELSDELLAKQLRRYERYISPEKIRKQRDAATMYPSPITVSPVTRRRLRDVYMKSEAIQTSPSVRSTSPCHSYDEVPVATVPLMADAKHRKQSPSPDQSSLTHSRMSRSPADKSRSRSSGSRKSLRKSSRSPSVETQTSISHSVSKTKTGSQTRRKKLQSPMWKPETPPKNSMFEPETTDENREPYTKDQDIPQGLSWFVPLKPSQPWRKPLKERQAFSVSQEPWEPKSVSQSTWKNIVHGDILKDRSDVTNVSRDTKFDLDTTGQRIGDEESISESEESDEDVLQSKPLSKMSLQEAFMQRKQVVLSRLRERQKRLHLAAEERKMQAYLQLERDRLFQEEKRKDANPEAHPYSDNLFRPARRVISKEEMKEMAKKKYQKLPEVVQHEKLKKRSEQYALNRLKARLFNRKVQRQVLVRAEKWGQ